MNLIVPGNKENRKLLLFLALIVTISFLLTGCSTEKEVIGVLDVNKVMTDSPKIKKFQDQLNVKGKELSDKLEQEKEGISQEEFQRRQEAAYGEFLKTKQELETQIDQSIKTAVEEVGKEKKIGVILFKNSVAHGGIDVTEDVLKKMQ